MAKAKEHHFAVGYICADRISYAVKAEVRSVLSLRIAETAIALERIRSESGSYPKTLEELPLTSTNITRNPFNGKPFGYERVSKGYSLECDLYGINSKDIKFRVVNPPLQRSAATHR
jgi:hypothetical protein